MKKILLPFVALLPFCVVGQHVEQIADVAENTDSKTIQEVRSNAKAGAIIWSEDFSNGWPTGWIKIDSSGICPWSYSTDGSWGNFNGNNAAAGAAAIQSTTSSDGFLICDPDSANHYTYGQPSGTTYQYLASYFEIPPIDCGTNSSVILEFEQKYRYNNSIPMYVIVSNDSTNWTTFDVSGGLSNNTISADPDIVTLNISAIAANQTKVHIRIGWNARVYYWMIDDMVLREGNDDDLTNLSGYWETGAELLEYYQTPLSQITPITFKGSFTNNGNNDVADVSQTVDVQFGGNSVHNAASPAQISLIANTDSVTQAGTFTPASGVGTYDLEWTVGSSSATDLNNSDNTTTRDLLISNTIYARDNGVQTGMISNFASNSNQPFKIGNIFETFAADNFCWVHVGIDNNATNDGQIIFAEVYKWSDLSASFEFVEATDDYVINTVDLGTIVPIQLFSAINAEAGDLYLVVAGHYGGTDDVRFMVTQSVEERTVFGFNAAGSLAYLSSPRAPIVRIDFSPCTWSVEESNIENLIMSPNPTTGQVNISFQFNSASNVKIEIVDAQGRIVESVMFDNIHFGENNINLDCANLTNGVYFFKIISGQETKTKRFVVSK